VIDAEFVEAHLDMGWQYGVAIRVNNWLWAMRWPLAPQYAPPDPGMVQRAKESLILTAAKRIK